MRVGAHDRRRFESLDAASEVLRQGDARPRDRASCQRVGHGTGNLGAAAERQVRRRLGARRDAKASLARDEIPRRQGLDALQSGRDAIEPVVSVRIRRDGEVEAADERSRHGMAVRVADRAGDRAAPRQRQPERAGRDAQESRGGSPSAGADAHDQRARRRIGDAERSVASGRRLGEEGGVAIRAGGSRIDVRARDRFSVRSRHDARDRRGLRQLEVRQTNALRGIKRTVERGPGERGGLDAQAHTTRGRIERRLKSTLGIRARFPERLRRDTRGRVRGGLNRRAVGQPQHARVGDRVAVRTDDPARDRARLRRRHRAQRQQRGGNKA